MPLPIRAGRAPIGSTGAISFHPAIDGFGYQVEQTVEPPQALLQSETKMPSAESAAPRGWVGRLASVSPALTEKLDAAGILDEDSYLLHERSLDRETRHVLGLRRYEILEDRLPDPASFIDHLKSAPPWLLNAPIALLNLSVRSSNVCAAHEIKTMGDFAKYGLNGLFKLPNLGQKSVHEIGREMVQQFTTGHPLKAVIPKSEWVVPEQLGDSPPKYSACDDNTDTDDEVPTCHDDSYTSPSITSGLIDTADGLKQSERGIWAGRLGFRCEPMTLQQIADQIGLTRERVRQIEIKIYKKVGTHPYWDELSRKVQEHLSERSSPLFLNGVSAIDPWFEGAGELEHALREVCDRIPRLGFYVLSWNDSPVISRMSQARWLEAIQEAKGMMLALAEQNLSERDALSQVASVLIGNGEDMREALREEVSRLCIWSALPDGSRILAGFGKSAAALVSGVLQASDTPLHIDEIQRRVRTHSTYEGTNLRNISRAASEVGMLFGRGTYGLSKHCPLNPSQMQAVRAEVEDIISGGSSSKQWHSSELYDELLNRGFSYEGKLTKYIINMALSSSPSLVYLRRMVWGVRGEWSENADARLDVRQAIVSLLEDEGKPMSTEKIRSKLIEGRGLNIHFQIWASSPLVRLGPGLWGLEGRDVDMQQAGDMSFQLLKELAARQVGMHASEVAAYLGLDSEDRLPVLVSVASKDGLRMDKGQYCYLQPWGESRRVSVGEAATATLKAHPEGLSRAELLEFVERETKRKVDRQQFSAVLQNIDAIFDSESSLWKFAGRGDEDEGAEGPAEAPVTA
ncbi:MULTISPECIES: DNA-directed RNA polymerase subunit alpha C-terminal domain-containing protein [unclassified Variovorax]|uniref:DNA-directed RNA polymerase subunit alpha C-terminal domain-containing protein n=1 Tax=unclassified Variovorax TaxID=663243 RepID=UPI001BD2B970|nr:MULTISPECIES: DNA-directed RNA polymerase subunit alpha C-terminal domain-containing protein [unclassified Variovorax]